MCQFPEGQCLALVSNPAGQICLAFGWPVRWPPTHDHIRSQVLAQATAGTPVPGPRASARVAVPQCTQKHCHLPMCKTDISNN